MLTKTFQAYIADGLTPPAFFNKFSTSSELIEEYYENPNENKSKLISLFGAAGKNLTIGEKFICDLGENIFIEDDVSIGKNVIILDMGKVLIGNNTCIADDVHFYNAGHEKESTNRWRSYFSSEITIGKNVKIGPRSVVLPGCNIMDNVVLEEGSIARGNIVDGRVQRINKEIIEMHRIIESAQLNRVDLSLCGESAYFDIIEWLKGKFNIIRIGFRFRNGFNIIGGNKGFGLMNANVTLDDTYKIIFGDYCLIGPGVKMITDVSKIEKFEFQLNKYRENIDNNFMFRSKGEIMLGSNVFISGNVIIMPGVNIGSNSAIISSYAIITQDIPDNCLMTNRNGINVFDSLNIF